MAKSNTERQEALKARRKAKGLSRMEVWVNPAERAEIKRLLRELRG